MATACAVKIWKSFLIRSEYSILDFWHCYDALVFGKFYNAVEPRLVHSDTPIQQIVDWCLASFTIWGIHGSRYLKLHHLILPLDTTMGLAEAELGPGVRVNMTTIGKPSHAPLEGHPEHWYLAHKKLPPL